MAETTLSSAFNLQLKDYLRQNLIRILIELMIGIIVTLTIFIFLICLQTNGLIGSRTEVIYKGRDEEFLLSPQYLFKHEASAPIPATMFPAEDDFTTFEPDPPFNILSDKDYFQKFVLTTTQHSITLPEFEPINFNKQPEDKLQDIGLVNLDMEPLEPNDQTTDPEIVSDDITEAARILKIVQDPNAHRSVLLDQSGTKVDADTILGLDDSETDRPNHEVLSFFGPFNQQESINPIFNFMNGLNSQEDLTISNTNRHHQWIPFFKPFFPLRKKQRLTKRMSSNDELEISESGKHEVRMESPNNEIPKMKRIQEVFNRVDNYISKRIQNAIHKLKHIFDSEQKFVENLKIENQGNIIKK